MDQNPLPALGNPALDAAIAERIGSAGSIGFDEFMRLALYHPRHGYYFTSDPRRDYQSSPNVHPVFGTAIARLIGGCWRQMDRPAEFQVIEAGAGNGRLAIDLLTALRHEEPDLYDACTYTLQDVTLDPGRAQALLDAGLPLDKTSLVTELPSSPIEGCILSNELLDALPVRRVRMRHGALFEVNVTLEDGRYADAEVPASTEVGAYFDALGLRPGEGCEAEVNLEAPLWATGAAHLIRRGYVLTLDYGYTADELYAPWRKQGTLLTFHRHIAGSDPYVRAGLQDITASVDFTTVMRAGAASGLQTHTFATQAELLASLGIGDLLAHPPLGADMEAFYALRRAVIELTDTAGLGRIKALIQSRGV